MKYLLTMILALALPVVLATGISCISAGPAAANPAAVEAVNAVRAQKKRRALTYSPTLEAAAMAHAQDMVNNGFFAHRGSNGSKPSQRVKAQGYCMRFVAENIAQGQRSLASVMNGWVNSPGHYKNIVNRKAREFGLARGPKNTWVMVLAKPC